MSDDDLIKEINSLLSPGGENTSKLQGYFNTNNGDDFFTTIVNDQINENNTTISDEQVLDTSKEIDTSSYGNKLGSAWLVSESTKSVLAKIASNELSINTVNKNVLAKPVLNSDLTKYLVDPIFYLLEENYDLKTANELRNVPNITRETVSKEELLKVLNNGWIRPAINITTNILLDAGFKLSNDSSMEHNDIFTPYICQIWCLRFSLMSKIKLFPILESEMNGFLNLDCPNLYGEFYENDMEQSKGSLIPFTLRLIHAELPLGLNKSNEAINRLYYIMTIIKRIITNLNSNYSADGTSIINDDLKIKSLDIWNKRQIMVYFSLVKAFITTKDYYSAMDLLNDVLIKEKSKQISGWLELDKLYHVMGNIYLLIGDLANGCLYFNESCSKMVCDTKKQTMNGYLNNGIIALTKSNYTEAQEQLYKFYQADRSNLVAINNYAISCVYTKKVKEGISILESAIQEGNFNETFLFNLCKLYELQTIHSKSKKLRIIKMIAGFLGDDYTSSCFKLGE